MTFYNDLAISILPMKTEGIALKTTSVQTLFAKEKQGSMSQKDVCLLTTSKKREPLA